MGRRRLGQFCLVLALLSASLAPEAFALSTAFTYQGQLQKDGGSSNGACDFRFLLFDAVGSGAPPAGGTQIGNTAARDAVDVSGGVFTVPLDFGAAAFSAGNDRWLQIAVRCPAGSGSYQTLAPRQPLTPAPFALFANAIADGSVSTAKIAPGAVTASNLANNAVTAAQIADGSVTTSELANGAVSTAKIGDGQVTSAKLVAPLRLTSSVANTKIGAFDGTSTGSDGIGVSGTAGSGINSVGVFGSANAGTGVVGESNDGDGVRGTSRDGAGVYGESLSAPGVWGESADDGVFGVSTGSGVGVSGVAMEGAGVYGESINGTGVLGEGKASGVRGFSATGEGVIGVSVKLSGVGVHGIANVSGDLGLARGVFGESNDGVGVVGLSHDNVGVAGAGRIGVAGTTLAEDGAGVGGESLSNNGDGVRGKATFGIGVRGESASGLAGLFVGPVAVSGVLTAGQKLFKIDHPLDPANKYLMHAAVESPELKNIYDGVVVLDTNGEALVELPQWFEALNRDFRYQLTCIGGVALVYVADEISEGHFRIAGGTPGLKVSWQITGVRKDAFAVAHPLVVEAEKTADERGRYLYPRELGMPASLSVDRTSGKSIPFP